MHLPHNVFPVLVWEVEPMRLTLLDKQKTYQDTYEFSKILLSEGFCAEKVIYREGLLAMASRTELIILTNQGEKVTLHTGLGSILDFHVSSNIFLIDNYQRRMTRLYELSRGPKVYPHLLLTHEKKRYLEKLRDITGLYTVPLDGFGDMIVFKRRQDKRVFYEMRREVADSFESVTEEVLDYELVRINNVRMLVCLTSSGTKLLRGKEGQLVSEAVEWNGWSGSCWSIGEYLASWQGSELQFFHLPTQKTVSFTLSMAREGRRLVKTFMHHRMLSTDRTTRLQELMLAYLVYDNCI